VSGDNKRPIVIRRVKRGGHGAHHGGSWKIAYADFVTAMMAFFMLLWLLSTPDKEKLKGLAEYFSITPSSPTRPMGSSGTHKSQTGAGNTQQQSTSPTASQQKTGSNTRLRLVAADLRAAIETAPQLNQGSSNVQLEVTPEGLRITLMDTSTRTMFVGPSAILNSYARQLLAIISRKVISARVKLSIEGHTSSEGRRASDWDLSSQRAQAAMRAMSTNGVPTDRFVEIIAFAGTRPMYPDQPERPENRRITVVLLNEAGSLPDDASFQF
jgi:chemotaxis protein MotB